MAAWAGKGVGYVDTTLGIGCHWRSRQGATDEVGIVGEGLACRLWSMPPWEVLLWEQVCFRVRAKDEVGLVEVAALGAGGGTLWN